MGKKILKKYPEKNLKKHPEVQPHQIDMRQNNATRCGFSKIAKTFLKCKTSKKFQPEKYY